MKREPGVWWRRLASLAAGVIAGVILHYVLYRMSIPAKPFIYVAF